MNFKFLKKIICIGFVLMVFVLLGWGFAIFSKHIGIEKNIEQVKEGNAGFLFAMLGGYGNVISDFVWIRSYMYWEKQDLENCIADMDLAIAINPNTKMFWTFASSTLAYDSPYWIAQRRGMQNLKQIERIQAKKGIKYLERGLEYFPEDKGLLIDIASIYVTKLEDLKSAIACYERVCAVEDGYVYTRRAYADLLARDGQRKKAIEVLEKVLASLKKDTEIYRAILVDIESYKK